MNAFSEQFCGSKFWDQNLTWSVGLPDFTPCFQDTVLVWIPCLFLWIFSSFELFKIYKTRDNTIPWNALNVTKIILSNILITLSVCDLIHGIITSIEHNSYPVSYFTPFIKLLTFTLSTLLIHYNRLKGFVRCVSLFFFWLLMAIACAVTYWSTFRMIYTNTEYDGQTDDFTLGTRLAFVPIVFLQLFLSCLSDTRPQTLHQNQTNVSCEGSASVLSLLTAWWANALIFLGYKRALIIEDLWELEEQNKTEYNCRLFSKHLLQNQIGKYNGILWAIVRTYWFDFSLLGLLMLIISFVTYINPIILNWIIDYMALDSSEPDWHGYVYAVAMFIVPIIHFLLENQFELCYKIMSLKIGASLTNAIYKKSLRLSSTGRKDFTIGEIVNLMAIDTSRITEFLEMVHEIWGSPLQISIALYLLWQQLGIATLAGLVTMLFQIPINSYITGKMRIISNRLMSYKDERIKQMNEILSGIKVLKLYAWESSFEEQVTKKRNQEIQQLTTNAYYKGASVYIINSATFMVGIASFATYVLMDSNNVLTPQKAFVSLALFNQMRGPLIFFPRLIAWYAMFSVSLKRMNKYMSADEIDPKSITHDTTTDAAIDVQNASFGWTKSDDQTLNNITLKVDKTKLIAVVGEVGAGKSSLISALLGEMCKVKGKVNINGSIAYVPQQAWIQNASIAQNIVYTNSWDETKLNEVIHNCALSEDLDILPGGRETEIGEKGINLSGGQKQRVSMARACYASADIYLLDDPLSALDANVGKYIFDKVIGPNGMLKDKTRILVTHKISVLSQCDQIVVMKNGFISEFGSYRQLLESKGVFAQFLLNHISEGTDEDIDEEELKLIDEVIKIDKIERQLSRTLSRISNGSKVSANEDMILKEQNKQKLKEMSKLVESEKCETGSVKWTVYWDYLQKAGMIGCFAVIVSYMGTTVFNVAASQWLSAWSDDSKDAQLVDDIRWRNIRLIIYGVLGSAETVFLLLSTITLNLSTLKGARILHNDMLSRMFRAPMAFFDTTPMGRILNRFARDIDVCDTVLHMNIQMTLTQAFRAFSAILVMAIETPLVLVAFLPIGVLYILVQQLYIPTSRQLRRIQSTTKSPIYTHFSETLSGATSIRAYGSVDKFVEESNQRVDTNSKTYYALVFVYIWLTCRLELLGNTIIFANALYAVLSRGSLSPSVAGLTLSYSMTITQTLRQMILGTTQLETNIVSVERCLEYTRTPTEALRHKPETRPTPEWPQKGCISFERYSTRYRDGLELVLKEISLEISGGSKVGVVGRTGAGKSSLTLGLFRLIESASGAIRIDGVDISSIGLYDLRSKLTIIPQDPVLFAGTLRLNLDPFENHTDSQLWSALELAHLKHFVESLAPKLQYEVSEGGDNLSVGQKQLLCLARALLRNSRIIVLDEATAAVDIETDQLIQKTIRREFNDCTIVTIAHRLNTILDYDRVVVLSEGRVAEYDCPQVLLNDHNSIFYSMAKDCAHI